MKTLIKEIRPFLSAFAGHLRAMALATGLAMAAVGAAVGLLALAGWFITAAALAGATAAGAAGFNFFYPSIGVRTLAVCRTLARYGERVFSHDATFRILSDLRSEFYRRIEPLAPAGLLRFQSADILQRVVGDIDTLDHLYLRLVSPCAVAVFTALGLAALLGWIDASVALYGVSVFAAAAVGVSLLSGRLGSAAGWKMNAAAAALRVQVVEGIQAMGELLAFGAQRRYLKRIGRGGSALLSAQRSANRTAATASALVSLCAGIGALAVLWPACRLVAEGRIDPAVAALAVFATLAAFEAVLPLPGAFQHLGRTRAAAGRLLEVLDFKAQTAFVEDSAASPAFFDLFFESVRFRYAAGRSPVLDGFSLHIPEARRLVLMGTTGAGKSTLVHLLCRYWDPDGGRIRIGDADINKLSEPKLRQTLSVVSQRDHVFSATLRENLALARPDASDQKLYETIETAGLGELVRGLPRGLDTWIGEGGRGLSGGQARRLFIARAILRDAPIWVLDEPTEGLDRKTEEAVFESLFRLTEGKTVLVITHRPVMLERFDRAAVLEKGRIAEIGDHRSLLAAGGRYAELAKGL